MLSSMVRSLDVRQWATSTTTVAAAVSAAAATYAFMVPKREAEFHVDKPHKDAMYPVTTRTYFSQSMAINQIFMAQARQSRYDKEGLFCRMNADYMQHAPVPPSKNNTGRVALNGQFVTGMMDANLEPVLDCLVAKSGSTLFSKRKDDPRIWYQTQFKHHPTPVTLVGAQDLGDTTGLVIVMPMQSEGARLRPDLVKPRGALVLLTGANSNAVREFDLATGKVTREYRIGETLPGHATSGLVVQAATTSELVTLNTHTGHVCTTARVHASLYPENVLVTTIQGGHGCVAIHSPGELEHSTVVNPQPLLVVAGSAERIVQTFPMNAGKLPRPLQVLDEKEYTPVGAAEEGVKFVLPPPSKVCALIANDLEIIVCRKDSDSGKETCDRFFHL